AKMDLYIIVCEEEGKSLSILGFPPPTKQEIATAAAEFGLWEYWKLLEIVSPTIANAAAAFMQAPSIAQLQNLLQQGAADLQQIFMGNWLLQKVSWTNCLSPLLWAGLCRRLKPMGHTSVIPPVESCRSMTPAFSKY